MPVDKTLALHLLAYPICSLIVYDACFTQEITTFWISRMSNMRAERLAMAHPRTWLMSAGWSSSLLMLDVWLMSILLTSFPCCNDKPFHVCPHCTQANSSKFSRQQYHLFSKMQSTTWTIQCVGASSLLFDDSTIIKLNCAPRSLLTFLTSCCETSLVSHIVNKQNIKYLLPIYTRW